jgi:hypothetical protein
VFNGGGQFGKKPRRLIGAFGIFAFLLYKSRLFTLRTVLRALSRTIGVRTAPILMPFAEGPIDVDRQVDWDLANRIIRSREATDSPSPLVGEGGVRGRRAKRALPAKRAR